MCEEKGVELWCIGTELKGSVVTRPAFWDQLILEDNLKTLAYVVLMLYSNPVQKENSGMAVLSGNGIPTWTTENTILKKITAHRVNRPRKYSGLVCQALN